ncbi:MAG: hypothetical protein Q8P41_01280 [Pseudomonadota bacterium]|nr:hypothetical protein [Pseudomonadota bacterium]
MLLSLLFSACTPAILHVQVLPGVESGHYLLTDEDGAVWDCLSRPDGSTWEPVCVKADLRSRWEPGAEAESERK